MNFYFDTHSHLQQPLLLPDYYCLNVTTQPAEWSNALALSKLHSNILPAIGIHPWFVTEITDDDITRFASTVESSEVACIGEIGLDFSSSYVHTKNTQLRVFEYMLSQAAKSDLPVSIHCVKAHNEMLNLIKQYKVKGVMHGLVGSIQLIEQYIHLGLKIGINGVVCRDKARRYHQMVSHFNLDNFVLETDYPNVLLPNAEQCNFSDLDVIAEQVALLKNMTKQTVLEKTFYNAQKLFLR